MLGKYYEGYGKDKKLPYEMKCNILRDDCDKLICIEYHTIYDFMYMLKIEKLKDEIVDINYQILVQKMTYVVI